uniref:Polygalacturonase n=1 Tax=Manihot esculenta TaxID=3983 RepID=A0A199UB12_MANES
MVHKGEPWSFKFKEPWWHQYPSEHAKDKWITFAYIDQFTLSSGGTFDGQGQVAWKQNNYGRNPKYKRLLVVSLIECVVKDVTSLDSKNFYVNVLGGKNLTFDRFTIIAPGHNFNTDGIHIGHSNGINIINSNIATGDDCISIDGKTTDEFISGIFVRNCTIYDTDNGVRIKTWPALHGGMAFDIHFEDIMMKNLSSKVKIANVTFKNIRGSSVIGLVVRLNCSSSIPCEKVELADINLTYRGKEGPAKSLCANVKPTLKEKLTPTMC